MQKKGSELLDFLHAKYYVIDINDNGRTSSHWKEQPTFAKIDAVGGEYFLSGGGGFGFHTDQSVKKPFCDWSAIIVYFFKLSGRFSLLKNIRRSMMVAKGMGHPFTYNCFRALWTYTKTIHGKNFSNIAIIGDGLGYLAGLIHEFDPNANIYHIDLGKTLAFQVAGLSRAYPNSRLFFVDDEFDIKSEGNASGMLNFCPAEHLWNLKSIRFDCFVNTASMQEMTMAVIEDYFRLGLYQINPLGSHQYVNAKKSSEQGKTASSNRAFCGGHNSLVCC